MLKRAMVIGASSGMGEQLCRVLAREGFHVAMIARRQDRLDALRKELQEAWPDRTFVEYVHDVRQTELVPELFERATKAMDGCDLVVYAAGVMPAVGPDEFDTALDKLIIDVNVTGGMAWLNAAATRFQAMGAGTIVGISSVAGDRGRRGSPAYCASKAAFTTYLEALRNRLAVQGVDVVTIKPGPVATPMTEGLEGLPMIIGVEDAAEQIWKAIAARATTRYIPAQWGPIMTAIRHIPSVIFRRMSI